MQFPLIGIISIALFLVACGAEPTATTPRDRPAFNCQIDDHCSLCFCADSPVGQCIPTAVAVERENCERCQPSPEWCGCQSRNCKLFGLEAPTPDQVPVLSTEPVGNAPPPRPNTPRPTPTPEPVVELPKEAPNSCQSDADCMLTTIGTNPTLKDASEYGSLGSGSDALQILLACTNTEYFQSYGEQQLLRTKTADFNLIAPGVCVCAQEVCAFQ